MRKAPVTAAVLAACGCVAPVAAHAGVPVASTVSVAKRLPASGTASARLRCPSTGVVVAGAVRGPGLNVRASEPAGGAETWRFVVGRAQGADARRFVAQVRCLRLRLPLGVRGVSLRVSEHARPVEAGVGGVEARLRCPAGQIPTGWGFARRPSAALATRLDVRRAIRDARGWRFAIDAPAFGGGGGLLKLRCLGLAQSGRRGGEPVRHRFAVRSRSASREVSGPTGAVTKACRSGEASLMPGFALHGGLALGQVHLRGERGAGLTVTHRGAAAGAAELHVPCLSLRTSFR